MPTETAHTSEKAILQPTWRYRMTIIRLMWSEVGVEGRAVLKSFVRAGGVFLVLEGLLLGYVGIGMLRKRSIFPPVGMLLIGNVIVFAFLAGRALRAYMQLFQVVLDESGARWMLRGEVREGHEVLLLEACLRGKVPIPKAVFLKVMQSKVPEARMLAFRVFSKGLVDGLGGR